MIAREDFALGGLGARLRTPSVRLLVLPAAVLPADPEAEIVAIDDRLWAWMDFQNVEVGGRNVRLGSKEVTTAHAAALVDSHGLHETWTSYVAIHRSGAFEYGLGDRGASEQKDNNRSYVSSSSSRSSPGRGRCWTPRPRFASASCRQHH